VAKQQRYCVIDTQVVVLANAKTSRHASASQKARWALLRHAITRTVTPVYGRALLQEYVEKLKGAARSDLIKEFVKALQTHGKVNEKGLLHHERAELRTCRYPTHDEHLVKTAKTVPGVVIAAEEQPILSAATCVNSSSVLQIEIRTPSDTLDGWDLASA